MSDYIPQHLLANVLLRLPFDSLIRSRCVSKSWHALIDSSYFIKMHFECSLQTNFHEEAKIIALNQMNKFYAFDLDQVGSSVTNVAELNYPLEISEHGVGFLGSCNGLLCLLNLRTDDIVLWHPWIQKCFTIPSPPYEYSISCRGSLGAKFGYDRVNDDYKVVKWITFSDFCAHNNYVQSPKRYELCVYSLKLNSWRKVRNLPFELPEFYFFSKDCSFANGALHWFVTSDPINGVKFILAFDLSSEEFQKIPCPIYREHSYKQNLWTLNGCLSLLCCYSSSERDGVDLWVMEDYGVEESWTKLTSIEMHHVRYLWPVTYSKKRRQLVLQICWEKLMVYDIETNSISDVAICGKVSSVESCVCVGSLIMPC